MGRGGGVTIGVADTAEGTLLASLRTRARLCQCREGTRGLGPGRRVGKADQSRLANTGSIPQRDLPRGSPWVALPCGPSVEVGRPFRDAGASARRGLTGRARYPAAQSSFMNATVSYRSNRT